MWMDPRTYGPALCLGAPSSRRACGGGTDLAPSLGSPPRAGWAPAEGGDRPGLGAAGSVGLQRPRPRSGSRSHDLRWRDRSGPRFRGEGDSDGSAGGSMILADMVTRLSEELRKGKTEKNTCDLSKLPTFGSAKTPKREEADMIFANMDLTLCGTNLNEMETHLSKEQRKRTTEENDWGHLPKQPSCTSIKKLKQEESLYLTNCRTNLNEMETHLSKDQRKRKIEENTSGPVQYDPYRNRKS
ncbi:Bromodomain adjacent to zinc finger domain protein 2B [Manis javanica]|nr:Bromodomain adjacent to zinc finger domain protein 2B [Manis javanica]